MELTTVLTDARIRGMRAVGWILSVLGDEVTRLAYLPWRDDPYPVYERMRRSFPLYRSRTGMLAITSYRVCDEVLRDGRFRVQMTDGRVGGATGLGFPPEHKPQPSLLELDPPTHSRLRVAARPPFAPARVRGYRKLVERYVDRLLDSVLTRGEFDLIADFANPLAILVITELFGMDDVDLERMAYYGRVVGTALGGITSPRQAREVSAVTRTLEDMCAGLVEARRARPGDDIVSELVGAMERGSMDADETVATSGLLLVAGFETTVHLIGNGVAALLTHPDQWAVLREEPGLASQAVEETLRWDPSVQLGQRIAHEDVDLFGQRVPRNAVLLLVLAATGRDPEVHREPARFDITRTGEAEHLAFATGIHHCLGAPLARLEAAVAFQRLAERAPGLALAGGAARRDSMIIRGYRHLPVRA